ncbi:hypothetical protein [Pseudoxanthomonas taiwanensis]|nr:hypothetical protein [Pseudoxanthomonas taiwanensis]
MEHECPELPDPCLAASPLLQESCDAAGVALFLEAVPPADPSAG